jgi:hypothetical protein
MKISLNRTDKLFSQFIRLQAGGKCERCGSVSPALQCAHFHGRRKRSVRWDADNALCLCFGCHQYFHENPDEHREFMRRKLGQRLDLLESRARISYPKPDEAIIQLWLKDAIKKLEVKG